MTGNKNLVAFLDILGYRGLLKQNSKPDDAKKILNFLSDAISKALEKNLSLVTDNKIEYRILSDAIVLNQALPRKEKDYIDEIFWFMVLIVYLQGELAFSGIFLRGGVTIGNHYEKKDIIFSPALAKAYELESEIAVNPRAIIDPDIIDIIKKHSHDADSNSWNILIKRDADFQYFIDYISFLNELDDPDNIPILMANLRKIITTELLKNQSPKILTKYIWLGNYYNQKVDEFDLDHELYIERKSLIYNDSCFTIYGYIISFTKKNSQVERIAAFKSDNFPACIFHLKKFYPNHSIKTTAKFYSEELYTKVTKETKDDYKSLYKEFILDTKNGHFV